MISYLGHYLKTFMDVLFNPITLAIIVIFIVVYSSILHEIAHGYVAYRFGDPTAKVLGRLTLNPLKHIDPVMSLLIPLVLYFTSPVIFGGAKPVPIDPFNLRDGRKDLALVALAGPLTNLLLAIVAGILIHLLFPHTTANDIIGGMFFNQSSTGTLNDFFLFVLSAIMRLNLLLAIFNLIPIPPLDGSKVFAMLLPERDAAVYLSFSSIGMFVIFMLLFVNLGPFSLMGLIQALQSFLLSLLGF